MTVIASPGLERRPKAEGAGEILFDSFTRGRYATASSYQMMPLGVVVPRNLAEAEKAIAVARSEGVTVLPRVLPMRPDRQPFPGDRLLEAPQQHMPLGIFERVVFLSSAHCD
jgi:hypothetical protein